MIFTRRFGALAARPNFRKADEAAHKPYADVTSAEAELQAVTSEVESDSAYAGSK